MVYQYNPAPEPMPAEAKHISPPCCVSTHRSLVVDPDGPPTFLDHREAVSGIPQMTSFTRVPGHPNRLPVESSSPPVSGWGVQAPLRSEEHTSELQSQSNLVCRLLLEKK